MSGYNFLSRFSQMNVPQQQNALLSLPQQNVQTPMNKLLGFGTLGAPFQTQLNQIQNGGINAGQPQQGQPNPQMPNPMPGVVQRTSSSTVTNAASTVTSPNRISLTTAAGTPAGTPENRNLRRTVGANPANCDMP